MIVTIDGPAGAGKSSAAKLLAKELGFRFLDTGAMYRAVTWTALQRKISLHDTKATAAIAREIQIEFSGESIFVNGEDVTSAIRTQDVTRSVGPVADSAEVRSVLVDLQRQIARDGNYICEGRDQGTVVFPDAEVKIFLTASPEYRAYRRVLELERLQVPADFGLVLYEQNRRDNQDENRPVGRLQKASDAIEIITDNMTLAQVVEELKIIVLSRQRS